VINILPEWQILRVKREVNFAAHGLAKAGVKQVIHQEVWIKKILICIFDIVLLVQTALVLLDE
jgi:hypothetical protein